MTGIDGQNRMVADPTAGARYVYDGNGTRVQKCLPNCTSPSSSTVFIFSGSQDIAEYDNGAAPASPSREFVYSAGLPGAGLLATLTGGPSPTITYFHDDHLSWRISTDGTPGSPTYGQVNGSQGSYPFGDSWYSSNGNEFAFTSYQRDAESGLDYAMARYYDSTAARFCSANPVGGEMDDPQTWDRYSYVRNDPINLTDPNGESWINWLIEGIIGALSIALPELDPALFSFLGSSASAADATSGAFATQNFAVSAGIAGQATTIAVSNLSSVTVTAAATSSISTAPILLGAAALSAAQTSSAHTAQQPPQQQPKKNCPQVPPHPKDANIDANIRSTEEAQAGAAASNSSPLGWWVNQVKTYGPWDYKNRFPGAWRQWDDFGNFNYGATGSVLGLSEQSLDRGAVVARLLKHPLSQLWNYGLGNNPRKIEMIRQGMQYQKNNCGNFGFGTATP